MGALKFSLVSAFLTAIASLAFYPIGSHATVAEPARMVSMIAVVSDPESFQGKRVAVMGWLVDYSLFVTREHFIMNDGASSLQFEGGGDVIEEIMQNCSEGYAKVEGRVSHTDGLFTLADISLVVLVERRPSVCYRR